jgi:hypothetical protein
MTLSVPPVPPATALYRRVGANFALPLSLLNPEEQRLLPGLLDNADLWLWEPTRIGPIVTLGDSNGLKSWVKAPAFRSPGTVVDAAALSIACNTLTDEEYTLKSYGLKTLNSTPPGQPNPAHRHGIPISMQMELPEKVLRWQHGPRLNKLRALKPTIGFCPVFATASQGGMGAVRVRQLVTEYVPILQSRASTLIIGVPDPDTKEFVAMSRRLNAPHEQVLDLLRAGSYPTAYAAHRVYDIAPVIRFIRVP